MGFLCPPHPQLSLWQCRVAQGDAVPSGFVSQLRNHKLRKLQFFIMNGKPTYPSFFLERGIIFITYKNKQIFPPLWRRESLSLFSKTAHYINTHEKVLWNKIFRCLCVQQVQKCKRPVENCLSILSLGKWRKMKGERLLESE